MKILADLATPASTRRASVDLVRMKIETERVEQYARVRRAETEHDSLWPGREDATKYLSVKDAREAIERVRGPRDADQFVIKDADGNVAT